MSTLPVRVQPGDIISSEFMNALLNEVESLREKLDELMKNVPGTVIVPNVFGRTLLEARTIITSPGQLGLGSVLNVAGKLIDPLATENRTLLVLFQLPTVGERVVAGTSVNLVVSSTEAGTGPGPSPDPVITELRLPDETPATRFAVGTGMIIMGINFDVVSSNNEVTFAGQTATVTPSAFEPTRRIHVVVPTGIPGAPTASGQADLTGVTIVVRNTVTARQTTTTCTIAAPPEIAPPHISSIPAGPHLVGSPVTITGTGFSAVAAENNVFFDGTPAAVPTTASEISLTVTVPSGIPGLGSIGDPPKTVQVTLTVNEIDADAPFPTSVER